MNDLSEIGADLHDRMSKSIDAFKHNLAGLNVGKASTGLVEPVSVEAYGSMMPINQVATVTIVDSNMLSIQVWDAENTKKVEKAIYDSGLGLSPVSEGSIIKIILPKPSEERRAELVKKAKEYAEKAKIAVRNIRRSSMDDIKEMEKEKLISEDQFRAEQNNIQKKTDGFVKEIEDILSRKEKDIKTI